MKIFAISGLGADKRVFKYLTLEHELIPVEWIKPKKKEPIIGYSKRLIKEYEIGNDQEFGILGVSFGGLIATEISKLTKPKFTILISSVETKNELSRIIRIFGKTKIIELIPESFLNPPKLIARFMFGTKKKELLNSILDDTDLSFTKWAIRELVNWKNESKLLNLIKIGGSKDKMLPPKGKNTILIDKGEHFMIADKAEEISEIINKMIQTKHCDLCEFPKRNLKNGLTCGLTNKIPTFKKNCSEIKFSNLFKNHLPELLGKIEHLRKQKTSVYINFALFGIIGLIIILTIRSRFEITSEFDFSYSSYNYLCRSLLLLFVGIGIISLAYKRLNNHQNSLRNLVNEKNGINEVLNKYNLNIKKLLNQ